MWDSCGQYTSNVRCWFVGFSGRVDTGSGTTFNMNHPSSHRRCLTTNDPATQIFSYRWSALSKPCITPKSSHWCPNDCFPSNLPAQEKQHSPSSSHHIVLCCNFYPGNVRLMGPRLDNSSSGHFVVILTWMDSISVKMMDNAVIFFKGVILNAVYLKLWTFKSSWYKFDNKKSFPTSLNFCRY